MIRSYSAFASKSFTQPSTISPLLKLLPPYSLIEWFNDRGSANNRLSAYLGSNPLDLRNTLFDRASINHINELIHSSPPSAVLLSAVATDQSIIHPENPSPLRCINTSKTKLVIDETMTGFGRLGSGTMFSYEAHRLEPDVILIATEDAYGIVELDHRQSITDSSRAQHLADVCYTANYFRHTLSASLIDRHQTVREVSGRGFLMFLHLEISPRISLGKIIGEKYQGWFRGPWNAGDAGGPVEERHSPLTNNRPDSTVTIMPPLDSTIEEIDEFSAAMHEALSKLSNL